jgi:AraC-like DNA-binding protein
MTSFWSFTATRIMQIPLAALRTPSTYTRLLLRRWPSEADALLAGTGLAAVTVSHAPHITGAQQLQVLRNAAQLSGRPDWALDFGRQLNIHSHGPLGFAAVSAPTLGEGLDVLAEFARIRSPYVNVESLRTDQHLVLKFDTGLYPLEPHELSLIEILLKVATSFSDAVLGGNAVDSQLWIAQPPPPHAALYTQYFHARVEFNAAFSGILLPASLKALPCPLHDERTYHASLARCREALDAVLSPDDVVARATHWMAAHFDQIAARGHSVSQPRLEQLAGALHMSPRTLIRQLTDHGTSFTELREAQQLAIAQRLLADARYSVNEVGGLIGYGDAANFGRAFRRVTGVSPGQYRRGQRQ